MEDTNPKTVNTNGHAERKGHALIREAAFDRPRDFLNNRFVYVVISSRAHGLSLGVNMNPDKLCNFDCVYCEVDRRTPPTETVLDVAVMAQELQQTLSYVLQGRLHERPQYHSLPSELLQLRHVALSGDGEPTLAPNFPEALQEVIHVRALGGFPFFKIVLITNATGLDRPAVQESVRWLTKSDEIWVKLDGGTQDYLNRVDRPNVPLDRVLANILSLGRQRPLVIQSLFPAIHDQEPSSEEIDQFAQRLKELRAGGAQISHVQIYSAARPMSHTECGHLPLKVLSHIAHIVRQEAGLKAEVF